MVLVLRNVNERGAGSLVAAPNPLLTVSWDRDPSSERKEKLLVPEFFRKRLVLINKATKFRASCIAVSLYVFARVWLNLAKLLPLH